jgi:hypothetical protein
MAIDIAQHSNNECDLDCPLEELNAHFQFKSAAKHSSPATVKHAVQSSGNWTLTDEVQMVS